MAKAQEQVLPRSSFWLQYLSLFSSLGTLFCCALPSLFVLLGLGATVASVLSTAPWLVSMSHHKNWTFGISGLLIAGNLFYVRAVAPRLQSGCSVGDDSCARASRVSRVILWATIVIYCIGFAVAYFLGPFFVWWDR